MAPKVREGSDDLTSKSLVSETRRRKREIFFIPFLAIVFLILTFVEIHLYSTPQKMPFEQSILFFGLVNFNILILLLLLFLIFRNVVKVFTERRGYPWGSSLKSKLIIAFGLFSVVPTGLMFLVLSSYNSSLDKWFSSGIRDVVKSSNIVIREYLFTEKRRNYKAAYQMVEMWKEGDRASQTQRIKQFLQMFAADSLEFYPSLYGKRILELADDQKQNADVPELSKSFLKRGFAGNSDSGIIQQHSDSILVRVMVPIPRSKGGGALVVSSFVNKVLSENIGGITASYEQVRDTSFLEYPLKSIFFSLISLTTLVILFGATWFGFYLSKQLSFSLELLGRATRRISRGDYQEVHLKTGTLEIHELVRNFNRMVKNLDRSQAEVLRANQDLQDTLYQLDEHNRYVESVLGSVSTGIVTLDQDYRVTTLNSKAFDLLDLQTEVVIGEKLTALLDIQKVESLLEVVKQMFKHRVPRMQKTFRLESHGQSVPLQLTASLLTDEKGEIVGSILALDDLTLVVNAQKAEAWTEVAKRIAHEIKNPLTPIRLSAERLQKKFGSQIQDEAFSECTRLIIQQTDDLKRLVNEFSQFARLPLMSLRESDFNTLIRDTLLLYTSAHADIEFNVKLDPKMPLFSFDPDQFKRVTMNLLENAVAAVRDEPKPRVEIVTDYIEKSRLCRLSIRDNGPGLTAQMKERIFEPYFSTKKSGTGLGLAIVKRIIEDHRGIVRVVDHIPRGVVMNVEIPIHEQSK